MTHVLFTEEERSWVGGKVGYPCVKDGAPEHVRESLEAKLKHLEEAEWDHMRARVANASQEEKDKMEAEIARMKEFRKRQREQMAVTNR